MLGITYIVCSCKLALVPYCYEYSRQRHMNKSRPSMFIRGLIPRVSAELAEVAPIGFVCVYGKILYER